MEKRRMQAAEMFSQGIRQADIARHLGVRHQTVSTWHAAWRKGGADALRAAGRVGRPPRLSRSQLKDVEQALTTGEVTDGSTTEQWTPTGVARVIEATTGVRYHPGHVWRLMRDQLGPSLEADDGASDQSDPVMQAPD
jgi:transposase